MAVFANVMMCKVCKRRPIPTAGPMKGDVVCSTRCAAKLSAHELRVRRAAMESWVRAQRTLA